MKTFYVAIFSSVAACLLVGCQGMEQKRELVEDACPYSSCRRSFLIDKSKSEFIVTVYGCKMGTPDWGTVDEYLREAKNLGHIDWLEVLATGIEGGAEYCVGVYDFIERRKVLDELQAIHTDRDLTMYHIYSVDSCSQ